MNYYREWDVWGTDLQDAALTHKPCKETIWMNGTVTLKHMMEVAENHICRLPREDKDE